MVTDKLITELVDSYGNWFQDESFLKSGKMTKIYIHIRQYSIQINKIIIKSSCYGAYGSISMSDELKAKGSDDPVFCRTC